MKEKPSKKSSVTLDSEAQSIFYSENFFGYVQKSESEDHLFEMKLYSMNGKLKFSRYIDFEYDNIYAASKEVIVTGGDDCLIMRSNGNCKYDGKLSGKIVSMVPSGNRLEYVVVYDNATEIIRLKAEVQENISPDKEANNSEDVSIENKNDSQDSTADDPEDVNTENT